MNALLLFFCIAVVDVTPAPQSIAVDENVLFQVTRTTPVVIAPDATPGIVAQLDELFESIGYALPVVNAANFDATEGAIFIGEVGKHPAFEKRRLKALVQGVDELASGAYRLSIRSNTVVVAGSDSSGTFYGLQTLVQWVRATPQSWTGVSILDWPDLAYRGVVAHGPMTEDEIKALAALRCNLIFFESDQFFALEGAAEKSWRRVFADARRLHIEPVPVMDAWNNAATLLRDHPLATEGRTVTENVTLVGERWHPLSREHVLFSETSPVAVRVSGYLCQPGEDYVLDPGELTAPFYASNRPAHLQRFTGGAIPEGATVSVTYSYVPEDSTALCPNAPEATTALETALERVQAVLSPHFIHMGEVGTRRLNSDIRCLSRNQSDDATALDTLELFVKKVKTLNTPPQLFLWDEQVHPFQEGAWRPLAKIGVSLPKGIAVVQRPREGAPVRRAQAAQRLRWGVEHAEPYLASVGDEGVSAPMLAALLAELDTTERGLVYSGMRDGAVGVARVMQTAWSGERTPLTWATRLNEYFDATRWAPDTNARLEAVAAYIDRQTITGVPPQEQQNLFAAFLDDIGKSALKNNPELDTVSKQHKNLTDYLALEAEYTAARDAKSLRRLVSVIKAQRQWNKSVEEARLERIVEIVESQGRFVPASVLFGRPLAYFRQMTIPSGDRVFEVPGRVAYRDTSDSVIADFDCLASPGPLHRIDYEISSSTRLAAEGVLGSQDYVIIQKQEPRAGQTLRGPMLIAGQAEASQLRLTAVASGEQAVLRELKVFARKALPKIVCGFDKLPGDAAGARVSEKAVNTARGFLNITARRFAAAPTELTVTRSRSHLMIGISAKEPRMATMVSTMPDDDAPLWEEENVEILLLVDRDKKRLYRFLVGPSGRRFDSLNGDAGWDAAWELMTRDEPDGWVAVLALPFEIFGGPPKADDRWEVNFLRRRHNVVRETSAWAHDYESSAWPQFGELLFR